MNTKLYLRLLLLPVFIFIVSFSEAQTITASAASGNNAACFGSASASPNIQQFTASGSALTADITVTAPVDFEVSITAASGYSNSLTLTQAGGVVPGTIIYVRSAAAAPAGAISGNVVLTSTGASTVNVAVSGTVNPMPTVNAVSNQTVCNNTATAAIIFGGAVAGTVYNWTNNTTSIGLAASGTGNIASFIATNATNAPVTATITVTPSYTNAGITCTGTATSFTITVNPTPTATANPSAQTICSGAAITTIVNSGTVTGSVYNWVRNNTAAVTGIAASGTGNISGVLNNTTTAPVTVTFVITPSYTNAGVTCTGTAVTATVVVNPTPTVNAVTSQVKCNGAASNAIVFSGNVAGTVYNWTNNDPSIGLTASGTGNIAPFTVTNATTDPVTGTITVTPSYTNAGTTCTGASTSFTITVNPTATVDAVPNQILCGNTLTNVINFSSPSAGFPASTVVYNWVNTAVAIGLPGSGTGNIPAFTATNNTTASLVANITVTPTYTYNGVSCTGTASTFSITVNPRATANAIANQSLCNGNATAAVNFSSTYTGGSIVYNWVNNDPSIGLSASGAGNIASFTATNVTTAPVTATIVVTPTYTSNGVSCVGTASMFTITVNPTASVDPVADETLCANQVTAPIVFTSPVSGTIYNWVNNNPSIGLAASGAGNIPSFTTANNLTNATAATITVRPTTANGCIGTAINFTITVNPIATVNAVANQVLCNGASTAAINFSSPTTGGIIVYNWVNNDPSIGIAASGTGNIPTFIASNITTAPVIATITVTPTFTNGGVSCVGTSRTFTITVNPTATVNTVSNQDLCNGDATTAINFTSPTSGGGGSNIVFNWVNNSPSIGLAASGTGDIASFVANNATLTPVTATITVTPTYTNGGISCAGTPISFNIMVLPTVTVDPIANQVFCNGLPTPVINFSSPNSGGIITYGWDNSDPSIGFAAFGSGNLPSFTATNTTSSPITAIITVRPQILNTSETISCNGTPISFTITVNPTPSVNAVGTQRYCANNGTLPIVFSGSLVGTTYNWVNNNPSIGLAASGTGNIQSFIVQNTTSDEIIAVITVTPTYTNAGVSCSGTPISFQFRVGPEPTVNPIPNMVLCNGATTSTILITGPIPDVTYRWFNSDPSIGLDPNGNTSIPSFVATNTTTVPIEATISIFPEHDKTGCAGTAITFTITVNPTATVDSVANQTICANSSTTAIVFTSPNSNNAGSNLVFNWVNNTPSIGLAASGTGNIGSFIATNTTNAALTATITVTPVYTNAGVTCAGTARTFTIMVNPNPTVNAVSNQTVCNGSSTTAVNFTGAVIGTMYNWTNSTASIGLAANGTGNIGSFTATNSTASPVTATITVTASYTNGGVTCTGIPTTFTITVNPGPTVNAVVNQVVCNGVSTTAINFTGATAGTVYSWTNSTPSIGLAASGTGNIGSFAAINTGSSPVTATITVTPSYTNAGTTCIGSSTTFTITVNPTATVNAVANQVLCNGSSTAAIVFSSPATGGSIVYNWTNNVPSIGIAASGTGNIPTFIATNNTTTPVVATITVTPTFTNGGVSCVGTATIFSITVNPTATVNAVANQTLCANTATTAITFTSPNSGNAGSNIVFNWVNNTPSIGLAASGNGNIASFVATNASTATVTATITVTPTYTNAGVSCAGTAISFTITVNPSATVNPVASQSLCNNSATTATNFSSTYTGGTIVYNWTNSTPSIGLAASGAGNIASFTATNASNAAVTATITVTPIFTNAGVSCAGTVSTFTITVYPTASVNAVPDQTLCGNTTTAPIVFSSAVSGVTYTWVNNNTAIGLAASGTGNIPSFTTVNNLNNATTATITVTPSTGNGCTGTPITFTITVNPIATVNAVASQVLCNGSSTAAIVFSSPATGGSIVYNWTNNAPSIGIAASGTGNIPTFIATNNTTTPVVATITVTPTFTNNGVSCVGIPLTFTITVNPTATVNAVANQVLCNGSSTTAIVFVSPNSGNGGSNVVFNWTNNNTGIGLAASGIGSISSFTAVNNSNVPAVATITVTPTYNNAGVSCVGTAITFTITVNPTATVNAIANQSLCANNATAAVNFSSTYTGGTIVYNWVNNTPSIGLAANGAGNIASFIATNVTSSPVTATITVTPTFTNAGVSCVGTSSTFTITVNPTATVNPVANQTLCANTATAPIVFSSLVSGTTYTWVNNNPSIGLAASGSGNIPSFVTSNTLTNATTATITVTPSIISGCTGAPITFTITVNPITTVNAVGSQVLCNGSSTAAIVFSSATTGGTIVYNWTNNAPSIGIAASGAGNIPTFIATNTTTAPVVATITVTPTFTNNGVSCVGIATTFTITVNPTATVNAVVNQVLCNGSSTVAIAFVSPNSGNGGSNVVFSWVNNTPSIGLAGNGTGNIGSFVATNATTAPITATIAVTPTYTNAGVSCVGTSITFTITVNPTATVNAVANQSLCNNTATAAVNFSTIYTGGTVVYNWVNNTPSIGLAASGAGNIASFVATNASNTPVTATITITPTFTNAGVSCVGTSSTFTITVNPTGNVNAISNQILCANTTTLPIVFSSGVAGTTYSWVNNNPAIGLGASGTGNIPSFVTANNLTNAITATITVTPTSPNGCTGLPITFTITVNPVATVNAVANQVLCNGASTAAIAFSSPASGGSVIFTWANNAPSIGLAASGAGNIPTFIATNTTMAPVVATITVTPTFINGGVSCVGVANTFTITVNPTATVNAVANQVLCNSSSSTAITFTSPNSGNGGSNIVFNWVNNTPSIGLAANGAGNIASFIATNTTTAPVVATITVTPTYTNGGVSCVGTAITFNITVNPTATVNAVANQSLCNNVATAAVNFSSTYTGGTVVYNWVNNTPSIGLAATGAGNIASFIATNATSGPVTATITVTPTFTNAGVSCVGTPSTFTITVSPTAVVNAVANQSLCANTTTSPIVFSSPVSGTTYTWVNNNTGIGLAANGTGNIPSFVTTNNLNSINATITVTPNSPFGCTGLPITFVITVNPIATVNAVPNQILCNGRLTDSIKFSSPNGTNGGGTIVYNWTNSAPSIGLAATGSGNILPFTATNAGTVPVIAIITVTPSFVNGSLNCVGIPITFSITVNPTAVVNAIANQTVCAGQATTPVSFTGAVAGATYNWVNSNPLIGLAASGSGNIASFIAQNPTFSSITGTITVTPNTSFGCVGSTKSFDIIVPALSVAPTAISTPALVLCDTNTVTSLRVVGGGLGTGANWVWYRDACGGTPIGTGAVLNNITVGSTTTFYVRAEGTCNITACASIRIQVAKLVTHVRQHWNDVLFFDNSSNNFVKWQWYKNGAAVSGATLQQFSENGGLNGNYYAVATDKNGNELLTCPLDIAAGGFHGIELKISPNPVTPGQTYRLISSLTPAELQGAAITVRDIVGTQVTQSNTTTPITTLQAPMASGMYIVTLILRNGQKYSVTMIVR